MSIHEQLHDQGIIRTREPWEETVTDFTAMEIFSMVSIKQSFLNELEGTFYIKRGTYLHCKMFQTATNHIVT